MKDGWLLKKQPTRELCRLFHGIACPRCLGDEMNCRCGWNGEGDHPCHRCGKAPGTRRFRLSDVPFSLAGVQPKFSVVETYSCDECWKEWTELNAEISDEQIRAVRRVRPELLDMLMIALNSTDKELRLSARREFKKILDEMQQTGTP